MSAPAVTAARVLVMIDAVVSVLWGLFALVTGITALSLSSTLDTGGYSGYSGYSGSSDDTGPYGISSVGEAGGWLIVLGLVLLVLAVVEFVAFAGLGRGERRARGLVTATVLTGLLFSLLFLVVDPTSGLRLVFGVPWSAVVLGLLWFPDSSRRFFGDDPRPSPGPVLTPAQVVLPWTAPPPPRSGDRWADERRAQLAAFCVRCGHPNPERGEYCGRCGAHLHLGDRPRVH